MRTFLLRPALILATVAAALVTGVSPAIAATGSWTVAQNHYSIYSDGNFATTYFNKPQTQLPNGTTITSTSVLVTPYPNGRTTEFVQICYQKQYSTIDFVCTAEQAITGATTIPITAFNGESARGTITIRHRLFGGTYPATGGTAQDTVTVNYTY